MDRIRASAAGSYDAGVFELTFQAMATRCRVSLGASATEAKAFAGKVLEWVAGFEARYSRFIGDSLVSRINEAAGSEWVTIDPETERIFALCGELHFITRGVFDPTALPLIKLWDWKAGVVPADAAIAGALELVGWRKVQRAPGRIFLPRKGMAIDLGGIGKEYAVDCVVEMAKGRGIRSVLVDFGQDVRVQGAPPDRRSVWHIGLEDPKHPGRCWAGLGVKDGAVATSGDYVRHFQSGGRRYGHILDVRTGRPVANGCRAVSVMASNCTYAGALSTTAFVLGADEGLKLLDATYQAEGCITTDTGKFPSRRFYEHVVS
ncbi:MAG TPA: FAD:protein FMN transferase [Candidatus Nitrosotalea sp.]|nr:FAD:protein FMN transferase [Candidatus Nitrosotalea sp.]